MLLEPKNRDNDNVVNCQIRNTNEDRCYPCMMMDICEPINAVERQPRDKIIIIKGETS